MTLLDHRLTSNESGSATVLGTSTDNSNSKSLMLHKTLQYFVENCSENIN